MTHQRSLGRLAEVSAAAVLVISLALFAETSGFAAPRVDIAQVQAQVRDLEMQAAAAHEEAAEAALELSAVRDDLESIQARLARERKELRTSQSELEALARELYSSGAIDPALEVLLADDPLEFLAQLSVMSQLASNQAARVRQARSDRLRLAQTEAEYLDKERRAKEIEARRSQAEQVVGERLEQAQGVLKSLRQEERDRLDRIQSERREQQQDQARQAQASIADDLPSAEVQPTGRTRALRAVKYALAQVGEPYSYSARPPDSWDCSKLTAAAWGQSGVGLTALSFTQWKQTKRIPVSEIQPGDLVFYFGSGAHHVAIYVGNGKMVSASNPSDGVELIDFLGPWYRERFSGVGRVMG